MADNPKKINWGEMLGVGFRNRGGVLDSRLRHERVSTQKRAIFWNPQI
jgi:hypothetical protein